MMYRRLNFNNYIGLICQFDYTNGLKEKKERLLPLPYEMNFRGQLLTEQVLKVKC